MPEECMTERDLLVVVNDLEDYTLNIQNYKTLQNTLDAVDQITAQSAEKLLSLCIRDGIEDLKYAAHTIKIITTLITKTKNGQCSSSPNFVPSAAALVNLLKTSALCTTVEALKTLCFETLNSYPDETLVGLCVNHSDEILELLKLYNQQLIPHEIRVMPIILIGKLLKILPTNEKATFVQHGIDVWFTQFIPIVVQMTTETKNMAILESLELLTDELVKYDYQKNEHWLKVFENIYTPIRYPALIKDILEKGCDYWHRLWIIFIKLLKNQITISIATASPINVLLGCVEMAFKMDIAERRRAFLCWDALINVFSKETNEAMLKKRLKLLMVPLTANNARVEEIVLAKFNTWWHLIRSFESKIDKFLEVILMPFLNFCFGMPGNVFTPGKISEKVKIRCVEAFINIVGHTECEGCVPLPKLNVTVFNTSLLVNYWKKWINYLGSATKICVEQKLRQQNQISDVQIKCVWKSFILTIGDLPENNVRRDLFNETLLLLDWITKDYDGRFISVIVNLLTPTLFENNEKIQSLMKSKDEQNAPAYKIINVLNKLELNNVEDRRTVINNLKLLTNWMMQDSIKTSTKKIEWYVKTLPSHSMVQWTALAESIRSCDRWCPNVLTKVLLWPLKHMNNFVTIEEATAAWHQLHNLRPMLEQSFDNEVVKLMGQSVDQQSCVFISITTIAILQQKLQKEDTDLSEELTLIISSTGNMNGKQMEEIIPSLSSIIIMILNRLKNSENIKIAEQIISIINNIMKVYSLMMKEQTDNVNLVKNLENIFNSLQATLSLEVNTKLKSQLVDQLKECAPYFKHEKMLKKHILSIYKLSSNKDIPDHIAREVLQAFDIVGESSTPNQTQNQKAEIDKFTIPSGKVGKEIKKEASIINTVVENGEEFVVVKSNWKFNPRKLTDNQKEKLQRKREDIPALYQDLSQSQDQFKLTTWKTDSQDTNTTSSKSTNTVDNEDVSLILKNIPNSEFIPKIIENVLVKPESNVILQNNEKQINANNDKPENNKTKKVKTNVRDSKSPRMALKDRVFRNMRNLMENSNLNHDSNVIISNSTENLLKTPLSNKERPCTNVTNSAPSQINSDRPSRVKRKPKKFDDLQLISLGKRRNSLITVDNGADSNDNVDTLSKGEKNEVEQDQDVKHRKLIDNSIKNSSVIINGIDSPNRNENNKSEDNTSDTSDYVTANRTLIIKKEHEHDSIKANISNVLINENNKPIDNISRLHDINNINPTPTETISIDDKDEEPSVPHKTNNNKNDLIRPSNKNNDMFTPNSEIGDANEKEKSEPDIIQICKDGIEEPTCSGDNSNNVDKLSNKQVHSNKKIYKSRIERELAIDMVEGHPFLKAQSEKRSTRKSLVNSPRKKRLSFNSDNAKPKRKVSSKLEKKVKDKDKGNSVTDSQNKEDISASQDFIESSQDSTVTTISVKPFKPQEQLKKMPMVVVHDVELLTLTGTQDFTDVPVDIDITNIEGNSDIELSSNKTNLANLTEEMDTQPVNCTDLKETIDLNEGADIPIVENAGLVSLGKDTQNTPDADTQPVDPDTFLKTNVSYLFGAEENAQVVDISKTSDINDKTTATMAVNNDVNVSPTATAEDLTETLSASVLMDVEKEDSSSSCNNEQRKKDFFDNTLQISPIKSMSPVREHESPSRETSSDYVLIKLTSPVQSNGEPFEICESPEVFTEDKLSPDKRDLSPPREEVSIKNTSPSSALSLKRNRPTMRPGGRAAQMLGLCVPDRLQTLMTSEKPTEAEESKRSPSLNTSVKRNLKALYHNSTSGENNDNINDTDDSNNFLKFERSLPATDCSPSGPILKRKLMDITDEATASPASKRKRVSFHDPPVSTTICVKKYLEPNIVRSPQNSAAKRLERQARAQTAIKSVKRLDNAFKLESILTKAVESFSEANETQIMTDDTEMSSLEDTPVVEVIKPSDLNDTEPICKELVDCQEQIKYIAAELSSPAMKDLLVKDFEGKVETIGDLAKMTELEVNRLCIKAPKVEVAKTALLKYLSTISENKVSEEITPNSEVAVSESNDNIENNCTKTQEPDVVELCDTLLEKISNGDDIHNMLSILKDKMVNTLQYDDLMSFCISLLSQLHDKHRLLK
ncbi:telomere-associated protein RIF1 [Bicyclus anynana]|uniref:Telomere-associated protein RIF1 n=1 Tax=Bicyclus anynana TaxID=110368 RepID=A0A6J1MKW8_BICAN|nr:telomere-associated protein RIF1 [Bicyclus anynana]XP_023935054.2 telomere-associated protein RIF1 [Bicyclus anynana]XP_023935056.2 telomere-associated protein RIF1 [Bicyclus anynana]